MSEGRPVCREVSAGELNELPTAEGIGAFSGYSPKGRDYQREALIHLAEAGGRMVAALDGAEILGYVTLLKPGPDQRWGRWPFLPVLELGGVEVARGHRRQGLARRLVTLALADPLIESRILYAVASAWCWDLEALGLSKSDYRAMLTGLLGAFGFREVWTNDPDVLLDSANVMLVRVGARVPPDVRRAFERRLLEGQGHGIEELVTMALKRDEDEDLGSDSLPDGFLSAGGRRVAPGAGLGGEGRRVPFGPPRHGAAPRRLPGAGGDPRGDACGGPGAGGGGACRADPVDDPVAGPTCPHPHRRRPCGGDPPTREGA